MIKLLHAADLHLDSPFDALPDERAAMCRAQQRGLLGRLAELCREESPDLVLLAGDLFDSGRSYWETGEALTEAFSRIDAQIFIAPGNHDYYSPRSPWAGMSLPENVHVFRSPVITPVRLASCTVWGAGFGDTVCPPLLAGFSVPPEYASGLNVMVLHGDTAPGSRYDPVSERDIAESGLDYLALGHIHSASGLKKAGATYYAWPGCPQGRGFDECGEKGVYIAELEKGKCALRFVPICSRRYERLEVDVSRAKDPAAAVIRKLPDTAERDAFRITLKGETDAPPDLEALRAALEPRVFGLRLRDATVLRRDIWAMAEEDTLKGLFLRRMKAKIDSAGSEEERERFTMAARYGLAAMENGEEPVR